MVLSVLTEVKDLPISDNDSVPLTLLYKMFLPTSQVAFVPLVFNLYPYVRSLKLRVSRNVDNKNAVSLWSYYFFSDFR